MSYLYKNFFIWCDIRIDSSLPPSTETKEPKVLISGLKNKEVL